jgi:hypothetical protein
MNANTKTKTMILFEQGVINIAFYLSVSRWLPYNVADSYVVCVSLPSPDLHTLIAYSTETRTCILLYILPVPYFFISSLPNAPQQYSKIKDVVLLQSIYLIIKTAPQLPSK